MYTKYYKDDNDVWNKTTLTSKIFNWETAIYIGLIFSLSKFSTNVDNNENYAYYDGKYLYFRNNVDSENIIIQLC